MDDNPVSHGFHIIGNVLSEADYYPAHRHTGRLELQRANLVENPVVYNNWFRNLGHFSLVDIDEQAHRIVQLEDAEGRCSRGRDRDNGFGCLFTDLDSGNRVGPCVLTRHHGGNDKHQQH